MPTLFISPIVGIIVAAVTVASAMADAAHAASVKQFDQHF
jgi:hypothetical protein